MANDGSIDDVIDPVAYAQIEKTISLLEDLTGGVVTATNSFKGFNDQLSKSTAIKDYQATTAKAAQALSDMATKANNFKAIATDLASKQAKISADSQKDLLAQQAAVQKKSDTVKASSDQEIKAYQDTTDAISGATEAINENEKATAGAESTASALVGSHEKIAKAIEGSAEAQTAGTESAEAYQKVVDSVSGTLSENIAQHVKLKTELTAVSSAHAALNKQFKDGTISQEYYLKQAAILTTEEVTLKQAIKENNTIINQSAKESSAAKDSFDQQSATLDKLRNIYSGLSKEEQNSATVGGVLKAKIDELDKSVKANSDSIGDHTKHVGDYGRAFQGLPGPIGQAAQSVGGFFELLLTNPIGLIITALLGLFEAFKKDESASQVIAGTLKALSIIIGNVVEYVVELAKALYTFIEPILEFYATVYKGIANIVGLGDAIDELLNKVGKIIKSTTDYEKTIAALNKANSAFNVVVSANALAIEKLTTFYKDNQNSIQDRLKALDQQSAIESKTTSQRLSFIQLEVAATTKLRDSYAEGTTDRVEQDAKLNDLRVKENEALLEQQQLESTIAKRRSSLITEDQREKDAAAKADQKRRDDAAKDSYDLQRTIITQQQAASKEIVDDQTQSYEVRQAAQEVYYSRSQDLAVLDNNFKLQSVQNGSDKQKQIILETNAALQTAEKQNATAVLKITADQYDSKTKLIVDGEKTIVNQLSAARDNAIADVEGNDQRSAEKRLQIEKDYNKQIILAQIDTTQKLIDLANAQGLDASEQEAKLAALRKEYNAEDLSDSKKTAEGKTALQQKYAEDVKQIEQLSFQVVGAIANSFFQKQLSNIAAQQSANDAQYTAESKAIQDSSDSAARKAAKQAELDKQKAQQDKDLADRQRKINIENAKVQKAISIAQIIANTAESVTAQLEIPGAGFGLAAAAAAIGALQLGLVLAQPIPAFEKGGVMNKDGLALFGEKGVEMYKTRDGKMGLTPSTPTIGMVKSGTEFVSHANLMSMLVNGTINEQVSNAKIIDADLDRLIKNNEKNTNVLRKAYESKSKSDFHYGFKTYR